MKSKSQAFVSEYWRAPKAVFMILDELARKVEPKRDRRAVRYEYRFLAHLYVSTLVAACADHDVFDSLYSGVCQRIPIPGRLTATTLGGRDVRERLKNAGLIKVRYAGRKDAGKRCTEIALAPSIVVQCLRASAESLVHETITWVNLMDERGRDTPDRRVGVPRAKRSSARRPSLVRTSRVEINLKAMVDAVQGALRVSDAAGSIRHVALALRGAASISSIMAAPSFRRSRKHPGFASYVPSYRRAANGRYYEINGGLQCAPREFKQAAIEGTSLVNSDIVGCHAACMMTLTSAINQSGHLSGYGYYVDHGSLKGFVSEGRDPFSSAAERSRLPRSIVKKAVYSVLMGARLTPSPKCSIFRELLLVEKIDVRALEALRRLRDELENLGILRLQGQLYEALEMIIGGARELRKHNDRLRRALQVRRNIGGTQVINAVGGELEVAGPGGELIVTMEQMLSHILTGIEQDFVSILVDECLRCGIDVLGYEHDGLVTSGPIPPEVISTARKLSLLANYARIEVKPFVKSDENRFAILRSELERFRC